MNNNQIFSLNLAIEKVQQILIDFASSSEYRTVMNTAFGDNYNLLAANNLQSAWLQEGFSSIPNIEILSSSILKAANGAFSTQTNTIYLAREFLVNNSIQKISAVLLEEYAHKIDSLINTEDSAGDEGAIFSILIRKNTISQQKLAALKAEEDRGVIEVNKKIIMVEQDVILGNGTLYGTNYNDEIISLFDENHPASTTIYGKAGNDEIASYGYGYADYLNGGSGNDTIWGSTGDRLVGGSGNDSFMVAGNVSIVEKAGGGFDSIDLLKYDTDTFTLPINVEYLRVNHSVKNIIGNRSNNIIFGNSLSNHLKGGAGNDFISGYSAGDDTNNYDDDTLDGGLGEDYLQGGYGNDTYIVDNPNDRIEENFYGLEITGGLDTVKASCSYTLPNQYVEQLTLTGTSHINGKGNWLNNNVTGNSSNNILDGSDGKDILTGRKGNDTLIGGTQDDTLIGGNGADRFAFICIVNEQYNVESQFYQSFSTSVFGVDTIADFSRSQGDKIILNKVTFTQLTSAIGGNLNANEFAKISENSINELKVAKGISAKIVYNDLTGNLFYNPNGTAAGWEDQSSNGGGKFAIISTIPTTINANDFIIEV